MLSWLEREKSFIISGSRLRGPGMRRPAMSIWNHKTLDVEPYREGPRDAQASLKYSNVESL